LPFSFWLLEREKERWKGFLCRWQCSQSPWCVPWVLSCLWCKLNHKDLLLLQAAADQRLTRALHVLCYSWPSYWHTSFILSTQCHTLFSRRTHNNFIENHDEVISTPGSAPEDKTCRVVVVFQDLFLETDKRIEPRNFANQNCLLLHKRFYTTQLFKGFRWLVFEILCFNAGGASRLSCVHLGIFFETILFISSNPHSFSFSNWFVYPTRVSHGHIFKRRFSDYMILLMISWHFALAFKTPSSRPRLQMLDICLYLQYCERSRVMYIMNVLETFCKQLKRGFSKYMATTQLSRAIFWSSSLNHHQSLLLSKIGKCYMATFVSQFE
jgi:hypothetical protein